MAMEPSSRPLCTMCARKGLTTYWTVPYLWQGQVVVRNKCGGYQNKTRSMVDSGGLSIPCMINIRIYISSNRQNHHSSYPIMPYRAHSSRRGTRDKLRSTQDRDFPGFLPVCMKSLRGWLLSLAYPFLTAKNLHHALMRMIVSPHKITNAPCQGGVVTVSNNTQKYYARVQNACLQEYARGVHFLKVAFFFKILFYENLN